MSQHSPTKDQSANNTHHGHENLARHESNGSTAASERRESQNSLPRQDYSAAEMRSERRSPSGEDASRRSLGMRSILNPPSHETGEATRYAHPNTSEPSIRPSGPLPSPTSRNSPPGHSRHSPGSGIASRRILTPRSPSLRAASFGPPRAPETAPVLRPLEAHGAVRTDPSGSPNPAAPRPKYNFPPISEGMSTVQPGYQPHEPRPSSGPGHATLAQYRQPPEPYRFGEGSQPPQYAPTLPSPFAAQGLGQHLATGLSAGPSDLQTDVGSRTRQMYLETAQGRIGIEVEVDTQAASRMADEKRRRNAGASARFRQRRKEKEREASQTISALENEMKMIADDRDFYMAERNYFRDLASRYTQVPPRPLSPRQRRPASLQGEPSIAWQDPQDPEFQGRNTRRRTSLQAGTLPVPLPPPPAGGPAQTLPHPSQLPQGPSAAYQASQPFSPSHPNLGAVPPQTTMPIPPRTLSYDSLRPQEPYDRSWNPGR